jgi:hypothetical protein
LLGSYQYHKHDEAQPDTRVLLTPSPPRTCTSLCTITPSPAFPPLHPYLSLFNASRARAQPTPPPITPMQWRPPQQLVRLRRQTPQRPKATAKPLLATRATKPRRGKSNCTGVATPHNKDDDRRGAVDHGHQSRQDTERTPPCQGTPSHGRC